MTRFEQLAAIAIVLGCIVYGTAAAAEPFDFKVEAPASVQAGKESAIRVVFDIESPWYIYAPTGANAPFEMLETYVVFEPTKSIQVGDAEFPAHTDMGPYDVYSGPEIAIVQPIRVRPRTEPGTYRLSGNIGFQVCKRDTCLPPMKVVVTTDVFVTRASVTD